MELLYRLTVDFQLILECSWLIIEMRKRFISNVKAFLEMP